MARVDHETVNKFLEDMRVDREELVILRKFYDDVFAMTKSPPVDHQSLMIFLLDALPMRRTYLALRTEKRTVLLSPPVDGFNK